MPDSESLRKSSNKIVTNRSLQPVKSLHNYRLRNDLFTALFLKPITQHNLQNPYPNHHRARDSAEVPQVRSISITHRNHFPFREEEEAPIEFINQLPRPQPRSRRQPNLNFPAHHRSIDKPNPPNRGQITGQSEPLISPPLPFRHTNGDRRDKPCSRGRAPPRLRHV